MYPDRTPWWEAPKGQPPDVPTGSTEEQRRIALLFQIKAVVDGVFMRIDRMAQEWDSHKALLSDAKATMLTAISLIDRLGKPDINPAEVVSADADFKPVLDTLKAKIAAYTPQTPPAPATPTTGV